MIIDASKSHIITTRDYIAVKPDGKVVICRQDMHTGKVQEMPLMVDFDGNIRVYEARRWTEGRTMYNELIKNLRVAGDFVSLSGYQRDLMREAADAIEGRDRYALTLQHEMMTEAESHIALVERLNKQIEELQKQVAHRQSIWEMAL